MNLNWIKIENVLSVEKAYINFDKLGNIVHVKGVNKDTNPFSSNGAGKSSIPECISLLLRGKSIRGMNLKDVKNQHTRGSSTIKGMVNDSIYIVRNISPSKLYVEVNGEPYNGESIGDTQRMLDNLLNTNNKVFKSSMVFGQENDGGFLTSSADDKREIIKSFLNASDIFKNRDSITELKSKYKGDTKINQALMSNSSSKIKELERNISEVKSKKKEATEILSTEKSKFIDKYSISEIRDMEQRSHVFERDISDSSSRLSTLKYSIESEKSNLHKMKSNPPCDNCGEVSNSDKDRISKLSQKIELDKKEYVELSKQIKKDILKLDKLRVPISSSDIEIVEKIKDFDTQYDFYSKQLEETKVEHDTYQDNIMYSDKMYAMMRFWEVGFSEKGLIRYIIRNVLEYLNDRVNTYLGIISNNKFTLEFNDMLEETILKGKTIKPYGSLSGGEKRRVSLSVMLALNDLLLLTGKSQSNIVFFDEVAESLDTEGVIGLFNLIKSQSSNKKIFIITHNELLESLLKDEADIIRVDKKNDITTITQKA